MRKILFCLSLVVSIQTVSAQDPFYLIEDFGHIQAQANGLIEYKKSLYVVGSAIAESDSIYEQNLHIRKYDLTGTLQRELLFDHGIPKGAFNLINDQSISILEDTLLISLIIGANIHDAIVRVDTTLSFVELVDTFTLGMGPEVGIAAGSHYLDIKNKRLLFSLSSNLRRNLLGCYDLEADSFSFKDYSSISEGDYLPARVFYHKEAYYLLSGVTYEDLSGQYNHKLRNTYLCKLNANLDTIETNLLRLHTGGISDFIHNVINSNGDLVITAFEEELKSSGNGYTGNKRPKIFAVDLNTYEILWEEPLGDADFKDYIDFPKSLILSHDSSHYIIVGLTPSSQNISRYHLATINKVDNRGKSVWYRTIEDLHEGSGLELEDVLATSDGYYVACGYRSDVTANDGYDSRVQMFMIKFDEDGNIVDCHASSLSEDTGSDEALIKVFPNPTSGLLYIENLSGQPLAYELLDSMGQSITKLKQAVHAELSLLDLSGYPEGNYVLTARDKTGTLRLSEQVVVNN